MANSRKAEYLNMFCDESGNFTQKFLRECFYYNGRDLFWNKDRPRSHFFTEVGYKQYVTKYSGRKAVSEFSHHGGTLKYYSVSVYGRRLLAHRVVYVMEKGKIDKYLSIDHIDGDGRNNSIENLRLVEDKQNKRNMSIFSNNTSGVAGVCWDKRRDKWIASIWSGYKNFNLGRHETLFDAVCARKNAEQVHGFHENHGRAKNGY